MSFKIMWYGHATLGVETGGSRLLVDPFFTNNPAASARAADVSADFILISHGHFDHIGDTVEIARRTGALVICNLEIGSWLEKQGVKTHAQQPGGGHKHPFGYLKMTAAFHGSGLPDGSDGGVAGGYLLTTNAGKKIYLSGDTSLFGDMRLIGEEGLDLAVVPIGDNYTMGPDDALRAVKLLQPRHVIPVHFNTWELIQQDAKAWASRVESLNGVKPHVLRPGESFEL